MKVLVSAYWCRPNAGSEHGVGWDWVNQISRLHDVWVITRTRNRPLLENQRLLRVHFHYVDLPKRLHFLTNSLITAWIFYYLWQIAAFFLARRLQREVIFDVAHHVTFMSVRPCFVPFLDVPSVVGPVGGLQVLPSNFRRFAGHWFRETLREVLIRRLRWSPLWRWYLKRISVLIVANHACYKVLPRSVLPKTIMMQIGVHMFPYHRNKFHSGSKIVRLYWGSVLTRWKGLEHVLTAMRLSLDKQCAIFLDITGQGEDMSYLQSIAMKQKLQRNVFFHGWLERQEQQRLLHGCDIFLFTSLHETTGAVLLEAMAAGRPVIVIDHAGPGDIVTDECGIKIKPEYPEQVVRDMAVAIERLSHDPELRRRMGEAGRRRVEELYDWNRKGEEITRIYEKAIKYRGRKRK
jgi:glycosyltransferase involved in cell wall biosynthesis